jgi:hypothetical protein
MWAAALITARLFDRPLGQNLLALVCAGILIIAGAAERAKNPPDDIPESAAADGSGGSGGQAHQAEPDAGGEQHGLGGPQPSGQGGADRESADLEPH